MVGLWYDVYRTGVGVLEERGVPLSKSSRGCDCGV
jgi:hypothetical protein